MPGHLRPSTAVVYTGPKAKALAHHLRMHSPAIVGRLHEGNLYLELASVHAPELPELETALLDALAAFE